MLSYLIFFVDVLHFMPCVFNILICLFLFIAPPIIGATQTDPPTVAISDLFPDGNFPVGQVVDYTDK